MRCFESLSHSPLPYLYAGTPRYASEGWVTSLCEENRKRGLSMRLAGHLCGERCNEVLRGESSFIAALYERGFRRVQVNATVINGVDRGNVGEWPENIMSAMRATPEMEWILQYNDETKGVLVDHILASPLRPANFSVLYDASCGTGVLPSSFPSPMTDVKVGYAGGIGPKNVAKVLSVLSATITGYPGEIWIDMESSLRAIMDGKDIFSLDKSFECIQEALAGGYVHPK